MAILKEILIKGENILGGDNKIPLSIFKNTPTTLVSASGHNHNELYYNSDEISYKFHHFDNQLRDVESRIEELAFKNDSYMFGGNDNSVEVLHFSCVTEETKIKNDSIKQFENVYGFSTKQRGYLINANKDCAKYNYEANTEEIIPSFPISNTYVINDFALQSKGFFSDGVKWVVLNSQIDSYSKILDCDFQFNGRQGLSSISQGFFIDSKTQDMSKMQYITTTHKKTAFSNLPTTLIGLNQTTNMGYLIGETINNKKQYYLTDTMNECNVLVLDSDGASVMTNEIAGFIFGGHNDSKIQKLQWASEAISILVELPTTKNNACSIEG